MTRNDFRVTSIFKIIIRIYTKNVEFYKEISKFLPERCLFIFCIFYLNERELNQQVCLIKYVENEISNSTSLSLSLSLSKKKKKKKKKKKDKTKKNTHTQERGAKS